MVYVDNYYEATGRNFGRMKMCHMIADTTQELLSMVDKIGVQRKWIQYAGTPNEHFDICLSKRKLAVKYGAIEINFRRYAEMVDERERHLKQGHENGREIKFSQEESDFKPCENCNLPDACLDFGCAIKVGRLI